jgi:hypothetical protein
MPLQAQQIVSLALQIAKAPGYTAQAGQLLNAILSELCNDHDLVLTRKNFTFNFNTSATGLGYAAGCGPNPLPADYLRAPRGGHFYNIQGTIYKMVNIEQAEFDAFVQSPGQNSYPERFYVDMSVSPPNLYVWYPASGAYPATVRYYSLMPDIPTPETSTTVPWFPHQNYLIRRLAGEVMALTDDDRATGYLSYDEEQYPQGAGVLLRKYLIMQDDPDGRVKTVALDQRRFGTSYSKLPNTKTVGW